MISIDQHLGLALMAVAPDGSDSSFSVGTLLMFVGGAILLAFFCSIGLIARLRDRKIEQRTLVRMAAAAPPTEPVDTAE